MHSRCAATSIKSYDLVGHINLWLEAPIWSRIAVKTLQLWARKSAVFYLKMGTFGLLLCLIKWPAKAGFAGPEEYLRKRLTANGLD
jgi:hypothetical protein